MCRLLLTQYETRDRRKHCINSWSRQKSTALQKITVSESWIITLLMVALTSTNLMSSVEWLNLVYNITAWLTASVHPSQWKYWLFLLISYWIISTGDFCSNNKSGIKGLHNSMEIHQLLFKNVIHYRFNTSLELSWLYLKSLQNGFNECPSNVIWIGGKPLVKINSKID